MKKILHKLLNFRIFPGLWVYRSLSLVIVLMHFSLLDDPIPMAYSFRPLLKPRGLRKVFSDYPTTTSCLKLYSAPTYCFLSPFLWVVLYSLSLSSTVKKCLAHSRCSLNICQVKKKKNISSAHTHTFICLFLTVLRSL